MGQFKEFMLEEGEVWDAVVHGVSSGVKAFQKKRTEQKSATEKQKLSEKIIDADKKEIKDLVKKIVSNGYTIKNGQVKEAPKVQDMNGWLTEWRTDRKHYTSTLYGKNSRSISKTPKS
jgi:CRISPR/Cas system-associated exonuclease Cas4 (RecB family)